MVLRPAWPMLVSVREGMAGDNGSAEIRWQLKLPVLCYWKEEAGTRGKKEITYLLGLSSKLLPGLH